MASKRKTEKPKKKASRAKSPLPSDASLRLDYDQACKLAEGGQQEQARKRFELLEKCVTDVRLKALIRSDLGALAAVAGDL